METRSKEVVKLWSLLFEDKMKFIELKANIQLAAKLNMDYSYFTYLIYKRSDDQNYIPYIIPKKSGDYRKIAAPCKTLKYIQRQIANFIYDEIDVKTVFMVLHVAKI